ncbi:MAG: hypothetical protein EPN31_00105 [Castellaniella sp.]|uniref:cytochrome b/b6 domain-containing protein n=1 Tax=Castellaniella sp. TaxID=1955812 RepID=UPI00120959A4|nr:cytochrome b/b6 domain-containing protein [Castellaniella sp.]TAN31196.1 MAG: hypothetical protein EPN31_00105 [Castellaniella sp.]
MEPERIQRHNHTVRLAHGVNAIAAITLIATGLALGDQIPAVLVAAVGGHAAVNGVHRLGGLAFVIALLWAIGIFRSPTLGLVRDIVHFRPDEWRWLRSFLTCILSRGRQPAAFHTGRFDPAQRLVLIVLLCATASVGASGLYLYILPDAPRWMFLLVIRTHVYGAWMMIAALCLHAFAGLGILRTHKGLLSAMFGDGTVPIQTARTLWPAWTRKKLHAPQRNPHGSSHTPP